MLGKYATIFTILRWLIVFAISSSGYVDSAWHEVKSITSTSTSTSTSEDTKATTQLTPETSPQFCATQRTNH